MTHALTMPPARFIVGLTGGIGSGKTAVSTRLAQRGVDVVDTDAIAHALTGPHGAAMPAICHAFGPAAQRADGSMDRDYIRQLVFGNAEQLQLLESILHPLIRNEALSQLAAGQGPYALLVVPLLIEKKGWKDLLSATLVVDCAEDEQIRRVQQRSGLSAQAVQAIMAKQASRQQRLAAATHIVCNDGDLEHLETQVDALHILFLQAAICADPPK